MNFTLTPQENHLLVEVIKEINQNRKILIYILRELKNIMASVQVDTDTINAVADALVTVDNEVLALKANQGTGDTTELDAAVAKLKTASDKLVADASSTSASVPPTTGSV